MARPEEYVDIEDIGSRGDEIMRHFSGARQILILLIVIGVIFLFLSPMLIVKIPAGYVGVKYSWMGGVQEDEFGEGWHIKPPWVDVTKYTVRKMQKTDVIHALSNEGLSIEMDATIIYRISSNDADVIHQKIGPDYENVIIMPHVRSVIREVVAEYQAIDIYTEERSVLEQKVFDEVETRLEKENVIVESVLFRNVELPAKLKTAIEEKKKAKEEALRMEYVLEKEKQESERKRIEAQGIADANNIIADSLTDNYLTWYWISNLDKHESVIYVPIGDRGIPLFKEVGVEENSNSS